MPAAINYGIEQARMQLATITAKANAGVSSVITKHGKPYAAVVPIQYLQQHKRSSGILVLRGTGKGLWGKSPRKTIGALRGEWDNL